MVLAVTMETGSLLSATVLIFTDIRLIRKRRHTTHLQISFFSSDLSDEGPGDRTESIFAGGKPSFPFMFFSFSASVTFIEQYFLLFF